MMATTTSSSTRLKPWSVLEELPPPAVATDECDFSRQDLRRTRRLLFARRRFRSVTTEIVATTMPLTEVVAFPSA